MKKYRKKAEKKIESILSFLNGGVNRYELGKITGRMVRRYKELLGRYIHDKTVVFKVFEQLDDKFKDIYKAGLRLKWAKFWKTPISCVKYSSNE